MRPPRTFTDASLRSASRYRSSLSSTRSGTRAARRSSAAPNDAPKVRHSQRGTIVAGRASDGAAVSIAVRIVRVRGRARQGTCTSPSGVSAHVAPPAAAGSSARPRARARSRAGAGSNGARRHVAVRSARSTLQPPGAGARVLVHRRPPVAADRERRAGRAGVEQPPPGGHVERVAGDDRDALDPAARRGVPRRRFVGVADEAERRALTLQARRGVGGGDVLAHGVARAPVPALDAVAAGGGAARPQPVEVARGRERVGGGLERPARERPRRAEGVGPDGARAGRDVVVVAGDRDTAVRAHRRDDARRVGPRADEVAEAPELLGLRVHGRGEDRVERLAVGVDVAEDRDAHGYAAAAGRRSRRSAVGAGRGGAAPARRPARRRRGTRA